MAHVTYPEITAGHRFPPTVDDCQCECGRWWSELDGLTDDAIGKPDLAHVGSLNASELEQIRERSRWMDAHRDAVWEALQGVAGGQR